VLANTWNVFLRLLSQAANIHTIYINVGCRGIKSISGIEFVGSHPAITAIVQCLSTPHASFASYWEENYIGLSMSTKCGRFLITYCEKISHPGYEI
jgi:hypothetical protein